jgi:hypothetical protein
MTGKERLASECPRGLTADAHGRLLVHVIDAGGEVACIQATGDDRITRPKTSAQEEVDRQWVMEFLGSFDGRRAAAALLGIKLRVPGNPPWRPGRGPK